MNFIVKKLFSARFLLAVGFGLTTCIGFLKGLVPEEAFIGIVSAVMTFYFSRGRDESSGKV